MTVYTAEALDLSRLPAFTLVKVDYAAEKAALIAGIVARFQARGVPFDVQDLETDSAIVLAEEFAIHKTATLQQINDAGRRLTLTYSDGAYLDHLVATYFADIGLRRTPLVKVPRPYATHPEDWEGDARFAARISRAPDARSGSLAAYELDAMTAAPHLYEALALNHSSGLVRPGQILVVLLGRDPDPDPKTAIPEEEEPAQIALAQAALRDRSNALATDEIIVRAARRVRISRGYRLGVRRGPDPSLLVAQARLQYAAYADLKPAGPGESRIGKPLAESREKSALAVSGVEYVHALLGSGDDVDPGIDGVIQVETVTILPEVIGA